jgi:hypothetical protein
MEGKSHHCDPIMRDSLPFSVVLVSKNTMLKMACIAKFSVPKYSNDQKIYRRANRNEGSREKEHREGCHPKISSIQQMRMEGGQDIFTYVIMEELSCCVETAILDDSRAISRFVRLST